ncbi:MAG: DMT family transporter [Nocardiopsaceae bacterium]|nr:DMT family transporter [Nocardiopsaceae bacterium]
MARVPLVDRADEVRSERHVKPETAGLPRLPASAWLLMLALAVINTSAAFLTWTHTQRWLAPHESAAINNTMTVQIALLALLLLHEPLSTRQWVLILVVAAATLIVQTTGKARTRLATAPERASGPADRPSVCRPADFPSMNRWPSFRRRCHGTRR